MKRWCFSISTPFLLLTLCLASCSKKESEKTIEPDKGKFSFGKVMAVSNMNLVVKEYDFAKDADFLANYETTRRTELGNLTNLAELKPGDDVVIDYLQEGERRRVTLLVKEDRTENRFSPYPGRLVIAPEFQQIGTPENSGGTTRFLAATMSILSTNETEQARLADLSPQPDHPTPPSTAMSLSGINDWISSTDNLPDAVQLSQVCAFAPWKVLVWGRGFGDSTFALYQSNELQFAWHGDSLFTTGPLLPEKLGEVSKARFEGPPAGTDLDGDGVPDLLIYDYSGGAHCCSTVKHIVCSNPPVLTAEISGWDSTPAYFDLDGDGRYEMIVGDASYAYWNACFAASPSPRVIYRIRQGRYEMAGDLMRSNAPAADKTQARIKELQHHLSRYYQLLAYKQTNQIADAKLTPEQEADEDFFVGQSWLSKDGDICIPPAVWDLLLELIYSGQIDVAVTALDTMWPTGKPHKITFANDLLAMIRASYYGSHLPWFSELERAFAQHYPPPQ